MPAFSSSYQNQTVQQLHATQTDAVGRMGRVVLLTDESYVVDPRDDLIVMTSTTSSGDYTVTFPASLPNNSRVLLVMPVGPTGADSYVTDGLVAEATFDTAGQTASIVYAGGVVMAEGAAASSTPPGNGTFATGVTVGDGTTTTSVVQNKSGAGAASYELRVGSTIRGRFNLDSSEVVTLTQHDGSGAVVGAITFDPTTGAINLSKATTIAAGGLTVTAGGVSISAGDLLMGTGARHRLHLPTADDDAAAALLVPPVVVGGQYTTAAGVVHQRMA